MTDVLFPNERTCVICSASNPPNWRHRREDKAVIVTLNFTIYRRIGRDRQLAACQRVRVCAPCIEKILATKGDGGKDGRALAAAIFASLAKRYSAMAEANS